MKKILFNSLLIFGTTVLFAQENISLTKETKLNALKNSQETYKNHFTKVERQLYDNHFNYITEKVTKGFDKNYYEQDVEFTNFIQKIFNDFLNNNPQYSLQQPIFFIEKNNTPNAYSSGFDIYTIYNGLFDLVENEHQLAAILGHEMAHNYLEHTSKRIKQEAAFYADFKRELRSIKKNELIKLIKSQDEIIQKKYDMANQSRAKEIAADSLGFVLYSNANFPKSEYLAMLNKLEEYDVKEYYVLHDSTYYAVINPSTVIVKEKWLDFKKDDLFADLSFTEHVDKDSVSSHPNTNDRKKWISEKFKLENITQEDIKPSKEFVALRNSVRNKFYETMFLNENFGNALYFLMLDSQNNTKHQNSDQYFGIAFTKLYEARQKHEFNKYVPIADANHDNIDYHKFLNFLWNLNTSDYKILGEYYTKKAAL